MFSRLIGLIVASFVFYYFLVMPQKSQTVDSPQVTHLDSKSSGVSKSLASSDKKQKKTDQKEQLTVLPEEALEEPSAWPNDKSELVRILTSENIYKQLKAMPHSPEEIKLHKNGALKVLALRKLLEAETDQTQQLEDLDQVILLAKDNTIQMIARGVRESILEGRDFFKDFSDGVSSMPIEPIEHQ